MEKKHFLIIFFIFISGLSLEAKVFKNSYIQFSLPPQWDCELKDTAWICRFEIPKGCQKNSSTPICTEALKKSKEAIIILAAKEASAIDTFETYLKNLTEPRKITSRKGSSTQSAVIHAKSVKIQKEPWVDGMHMSSELPHYYTRYLASIKGKIAVLVTFSAHKNHYTQYSTPFFNTIKTLRVISSQIDKVDKKELGPMVLSYPIDIPDELFDGMNIEQESTNDTTSTILFTLAILLTGLGLFIWFKSRK